jgi:hypothetical protein
MMELNDQQMQFSVTLKTEEVWDIILSLKHDLENSAKGHYSQAHIAWGGPVLEVFKRQETVRLRLLRGLSSILNRIDIYDDLMTIAEDHIERTQKKIDKKVKT